MNNTNINNSKLEEAILRLKKAVELEKNNDYYLFYLGKAYALQQDHNNAIETLRKAISIKNNDKEYFYHLSKELKEIGLIQDSKDTLKESLKLDDKYIAAHDLLTKIYFTEGEMEEVESHCHTILNLEWKLDTFSLFITSLYYQKKYVEIINEFENAPDVSLREESKEIYFYLARSLSQLDKFERAIIHYNSLLKIDNNPKVSYYLGCALAHEEKYEEALEKFGRVVQQENEYKAKAYFYIGHILIEQNRIDEAEDNYRKAYESDSQNPDNSYALGRLFYLRGDENEAISNYCRAIELDPSHNPSHFGKGLIYEKQNEISKAIKEYELIEQKHQDVHKRLGILYCKLSNYTIAFQHLEYAMNLGDESDGLLFYLGLAAININKIEMGLGKWVRLFERNPEDKNLKQNICESRYLLGQQYILAQQYMDAISEWEAYLKEFDEDESTKMNLAEIYFRLALTKCNDNTSNDYEIKRFLLRALELDPVNDHYSYYLGLLELRLGEYKECILLFRKLLETQADNLGLKYHLGLAMLRKDDPGGIDVLKEIDSGIYAGFAVQLMANFYMMKKRWHDATELLAVVVNEVELSKNRVGLNEEQMKYIQ